MSIADVIPVVAGLVIAPIGYFGWCFYRISHVYRYGQALGLPSDVVSAHEKNCRPFTIHTEPSSARDCVYAEPERIALEDKILTQLDVVNAHDRQYWVPLWVLQEYIGAPYRNVRSAVLALLDSGELVKKPPDDADRLLAFARGNEDQDPKVMFRTRRRSSGVRNITNHGIYIEDGSPRITNATINNSSSIGDFVRLAAELLQVRKVMIGKAIDDPEYIIQAGAILEAEKAAKDGDEDTVLSHLRKAGISALSISREIGVEVAERFIERALLGPGG